MTSNALNVLVIDDDEIVREQIRRYLSKSRQKFDVHEAVNKTEGKRQLLAGGIDCAVVDFNMGDGNAFSLLEEIRREQPDFVTPLILLTGMGNEEIAVKAIKLGINDYINKDALRAESLENGIRTAVAEQKLAIAEREHQKMLEHLSMHDELTGLPNRRLLLDRLEQRILMSERNGESFALMMIDLDRFKSINDSLGHGAGDSVLRIVGSRLLQLARRSDTYARLGGDEFAVLLSSANTAEGAITVAEKVAYAIQQPMSVEGDLVQTDASIGIAIYPDHGHSAEELLAHADEAMYSSKNSVNRYEMYDNQETDQRHESARIAMHVGELATPDKFSLMYQPKFELATGKFLGLEALARWRHPILGNIPPDKFIPILERSKLISGFTETVVDKVLHDMALCREQNCLVPVSVNISPQALTLGDFNKNLLALLNKYEMAPQDLIIEITETTNLNNYDQAARSLIELAKIGVGISIDDFGTGYTSIRYLREFPAAELKIDKLFVQSAAGHGRDYSIIAGIVRLAKGIGARTVAEGIESPETLRALIDLGCDLGQGYYLARPCSLANLWNAINESNIGAMQIVSGSDEKNPLNHAPRTITADPQNASQRERLEASFGVL